MLVITPSTHEFGNPHLAPLRAQGAQQLVEYKSGNSQLLHDTDFERHLRHLLSSGVLRIAPTP